MLKRQRPPSPPVLSSSFSNIPLIADSPGDLIERISKRRRTAPPVLDGTARGWARQQEDEYEEEEDDDAYTNDPEDNAPNVDYTHHSASEYKSANTVLRELHTLHQHRLLFTAASPSTSSNMMMHAPTSSAHAAPHLHHPTPDKCQSSWHHEHSHQMHTSPPIERTSQVDDTLMEEASRVTERYEGLNKMLGSYVLSRRRKLHSSDEIPRT